MHIKNLATQMGSAVAKAASAVLSKAGATVRWATTTKSTATAKAGAVDIRPPGTIVISYITPTHSAINAEVTIVGSGFGSSRGTSTVTFGGTAPGSYVSWSATGTQIAVTVPGLIPGAANIVVTVAGVASNVATFSVDFLASQYRDAVTDAGIDNTGATSVTAAIGSAITAYKAAGKFGLYFPVGTYLLSTTLAVPSGTVLVGPANAGVGPGTGTPPYSLQTQANMPWLKGKVVYDSNSGFADLKLGADGVLFDHKDQLSTVNVAFTRCHIRGGGSETMLIGSYRGSYPRSVNGLTFTNCEIERSSASGADNIAIYASYSATPVNLQNITFSGCNFGTANAAGLTGNTRMNIECWTGEGSVGAVNHYEYLTFSGCEVQIGSGHGIDFSNYGGAGGHTYSGRSHHLYVDGCYFHGATAATDGWGYGINLEWPDYVYVTNNYFKRHKVAAIQNDGNYGWPLAATWEFTGNTFDWDSVEQSITSSSAVIMTRGAGGVYTRNIVNCHGNYVNGACFQVDDSSHSGTGIGTTTGNTVTGNTFNLGATYPTTTVAQTGGATGNTITPNTTTRS
jgi:hypothetical protein